MRVRETSGIPVGSGHNARGCPKVFTCDLYLLGVYVCQYDKWKKRTSA